MKKVKKGIVKQPNDEVSLIAGSKIITIGENGKPITYILGSDIGIQLKNCARLFPVR